MLKTVAEDSNVSGFDLNVPQHQELLNATLLESRRAARSSHRRTTDLFNISPSIFSTQYQLSVV